VSQPNVGTSGQAQAQQSSYKAEQLLKNKEYIKASDLFLSLAKQRPQQSDVLRLKAAKAQFMAGENELARKIADLVQVNRLNEQQRNQLYLLYTQVYLSMGNAGQSVEQLNLVTFNHLNLEEKKIFHESSAFAFALQGRLVDSVQERLLLSQFLTKYDVNLANQKAIVALLDLVPLKQLENQITLQQNSEYLGWLELAIISRKKLKGTPAFNEMLADWEGRYLFHPAHTLIASGYFLNAQLEVTNIRNIAVFLPESGIYAQHAKAVKEGFMAAYYQQEEALRPNVRFYDTASRAVNLLYQQAVSDGAQLIIGPLNKAVLKELVQSGELAIPVLALNYVEELNDANLYQFALSPIDEVNQVVEQASLEGYKNALILVPDGLMGERVAAYFQSAWENVGGQVLEVQKYVVGIDDFSDPVKAMLNVRESEYRYSKVKRVIGGVEYSPRRRQDADVIFMVANHEESRLINPHFYHNRAEGIAVFGLSRIYVGQQDARKNIDLNGVEFCTIPWLFEGQYQRDLDMQSLNKTWRQFPDKFLSLIAFGIDAYSIVPHLSKLKTMHYQGAVGELSLNDSNRVVRKLVCAQFKEGLAQLLEKDDVIFTPKSQVELEYDR